MSLAYLHLAFVVTAFLTITGGAGCPNYCDEDEVGLEIVCGQSSLTGEIKTFKNRCVMERSNCKGDEKHHVILFGECPAEVPICNRLCIGIHDPVCAIPSFGGNFANFTSECHMITSNCATFPGYSTILKGYCPPDCPPCGNDRHYSPDLQHRTKCGRYSNGTVHKFSSTCELILENCRIPAAKIEELTDDECEDTKDILVFQ